MAQEKDPRDEDGKQRLYTGAGGALRFATAVIVRLPVLICFVLPVHLVYKLTRPILGGKPAKPQGRNENNEDETIHQRVAAAADAPPVEERPYDIVLFGATGFTGGLAAEYLARQYGNKVRWAIAGRKASALEKVRETLVKIDASLKDLPIIVADSADEDSLAKMCAQTHAVASTVGPFARYGSPLVRQCVANKTGYCDTTGEGGWVRSMIERHHKQAAEEGTRIVPFCGNDCVPYDLIVAQLVKKLKENNPEEKLVSIEMYDDIKSAPSGGTLSTMIWAMENPLPKSKLGYNPMDMDSDYNKTSRKIVDRIKTGPGYSSTHRSWYTFFVLSPVNRECVRRSNALLGYGDKFTYKEQLVLPNFAATITWLIESITTITVLTDRWLRSIFFGLGLLPSPGTGPSESSISDGYLHLTAYAKGDKGGTAKSTFYFPQDPGYRDTARILIESGLAMALEAEALPTNFGVITPAVGLGDVLLKRLVDTGCKFTIEGGSSQAKSPAVSQK